MSVTLAQLGMFVNVNASDERLPTMLATANALISTQYDVDDMPTEIADWAAIQTTGELWKRANSNGALVQYGPDGQQSFLSSDVLAPIRPMLRNWRRLGNVG